jgi:hypothetical protein
MQYLVYVIINQMRKLQQKIVINRLVSNLRLVVYV